MLNRAPCGGLPVRKILRASLRKPANAQGFSLSKIAKDYASQQHTALSCPSQRVKRIHETK
jgi:hypothetical protein